VKYVNTTHILGLALYGHKAASHRVRLSQYRDPLSDHGYNLNIQSLLDDSYLDRAFNGLSPSILHIILCYLRRIYYLLTNRSYSLIIVYGEVFPFLPAFIERLLLPCSYIYDLDDAFFLKYRANSFLRPLLGRKIESLMSGSVAVTAGNLWLADYARKYANQVTYLPSVVDHKHYRQSDDHRSYDIASSITIGWIGSPSTSPYLDIIIEPLEKLSQYIPVRLLVVGGNAPRVSGVEVSQIAWSLEAEVELIQSFDIGVMPLPDTSWSRGKCSYKLIQCMACGIPVVASRVGANVDAVPPNSGFLVDSAHEWFTALHLLASRPELRSKMGLSARAWVKQKYSLRSALPILTTLLSDLHHS